MRSDLMSHIMIISSSQSPPANTSLTVDAFQRIWSKHHSISCINWSIFYIYVGRKIIKGIRINITICFDVFQSGEYLGRKTNNILLYFKKSQTMWSVTEMLMFGIFVFFFYIFVYIQFVILILIIHFEYYFFILICIYLYF